MALAAAVVAVSGAATLAACGGGSSGGNDGDATQLLDAAFARSIKSADVKLDAELKIRGLKGFSGPLKLQASGPFVGSKTTVPKANLDVNVGGVSQGQSLQVGLLSTGDRAFLKFGGELYEQPQAKVAQANKELRADKASKKPTLGIDPKSWLREATMKGDQTVGGVPSEHVSAKVDVKSLLKDLNGVARKGTNAIGGATAPQPLSQKRLSEAADTIKDPTFDVYVGKKDGLVHRVSGTLTLSVPKADQAKAKGITGGSLRFTLDLTDPNGSQTVTAPASSRPISELSSQLGGAAALRGLSGRSGTGTGTTPADPSTTSPGTSATPSTAAFKRYSDCLDKAKPGDTQAIARCRSELQK